MCHSSCRLLRLLQHRRMKEADFCRWIASLCKLDSFVWCTDNHKSNNSSHSFYFREHLVTCGSVTRNGVSHQIGAAALHCYVTKAQQTSSSSRADKVPNCRKLIDEEGNVLIQYILELDSRAQSPRLHDVGAMANRLLELR